MEELKPCPFCGSTKTKLASKRAKAGYTGIDAIVYQMSYSVRCNVCHARGSTYGGKVIASHLDVYRNNIPKWATTYEELEELAVEAWNRRAKNG